MQVGGVKQQSGMQLKMQLVYPNIVTVHKQKTYDKCVQLVSSPDCTPFATRGNGLATIEAFLVSDDVVFTRIVTGVKGHISDL